MLLQLDVHYEGHDEGQKNNEISSYPCVVIVALVGDEDVIEHRALEEDDERQDDPRRHHIELGTAVRPDVCDLHGFSDSFPENGN